MHFATVIGRLYTDRPERPHRTADGGGRWETERERGAEGQRGARSFAARLSFDRVFVSNMRPSFSLTHSNVVCALTGREVFVPVCDVYWFACLA